MFYKTRKIGHPEICQLGMDHEDFVDSGWAIVAIDGDDETVIDWVADRWVADQEVAALNNPDDD